MRKYEGNLFRVHYRHHECCFFSTSLYFNQYDTWTYRYLYDFLFRYWQCSFVIRPISNGRYRQGRSFDTDNIRYLTVDIDNIDHWYKQYLMSDGRHRQYRPYHTDNIPYRTVDTDNVDRSTQTISDIGRSVQAISIFRYRTDSYRWKFKYMTVLL